MSNTPEGAEDLTRVFRARCYFKTRATPVSYPYHVGENILAWLYSRKSVELNTDKGAHNYP